MCKKYRKCKKDYSWNPSPCICENSKYLISIADTSEIVFYEIISAMDVASTKKTSTIATNITSTGSINRHSKKVRYKTDCCILHSFISDHITIDNYYYLLSL